MKRILTALALLLGLPLSVAACLWDRDTPVDEAGACPRSSPCSPAGSRGTRRYSMRCGWNA